MHTAGLNDTVIPYFKIKITEIPLGKKKKKSRYRNLIVLLFHTAKRINHPDPG